MFHKGCRCQREARLVSVKQKLHKERIFSFFQKKGKERKASGERSTCSFLVNV